MESNSNQNSWIGLVNVVDLWTHAYSAYPVHNWYLNSIYLGQGYSPWSGYSSWHERCRAVAVGWVCAIMLYQIVPMSIVDCQHLNWCFLSTTHCIVVVHSSRAQSSAAGLDIKFILHITWGQALKNVDWRQQNHYYPQEYTTLNCSELTLLKRQKKSWCNNIFTMQFGRENSL